MQAVNHHPILTTSRKFTNLKSWEFYGYGQLWILHCPLNSSPGLENHIAMLFTETIQHNDAGSQPSKRVVGSLSTNDGTSHTSDRSTSKPQPCCSYMSPLHQQNMRRGQYLHGCFCHSPIRFMAVPDKQLEDHPIDGIDDGKGYHSWWICPP